MSETSPALSARLFRWPLPLALVWVVVPIVGTVAATSLVPISPYDYWWHLVMGRYIDLVGAIPSENLFLYTLPEGATYFDQPWLGQWLMYVVRRAGGDASLHLLRNGIVAATWLVIVWGVLRSRAEPRILGVCAMLAVLLSGRIYGVRTQMFALLPYAALLVVLVEVAEGRMRYRAALILGLLGIFWSNVHGSFVLLPGLTGLVAAGVLLESKIAGDDQIIDSLKVWSAAVTAGFAGTLVNPHGPEVYAYVVQLSLFSTVSETVSEWQPVDPGEPIGVIFLIALAVGSLILAWRRREVRIWEVLLWAAATLLASSALRNLYWWAAVFVFVVPVHATELTRHFMPSTTRTSGLQGVINGVLVAMSLGLAVILQPGMPGHTVLTNDYISSARTASPGRGLMSRDTPLRIVATLRQRGYPGRIFHAQEVAGLLEFALAEPAGERVAFVDQRLEAIPEEVWGEYFVVVEAQRGWMDIVSKYGIETMLLNARLHWPIIQTLHRAPEWQLAAVDQKHVLFLRREVLTRWRSAPTGTEAPSQ